MHFAIQQPSCLTGKTGLLNLIKWVIAAFALWYLAIKLAGEPAALLSAIHRRIWEVHGDYLILAIALAAVNWGLETVKWQFLISRVEATRFVQAARAVLCGVCMNVLLPARAGDIGGRIIWVDRSNRMAAAWCAGIGGMCQLAVTALAGITGILFFQFHAFVPQQTLLAGSLSLLALCSFFALAPAATRRFFGFFKQDIFRYRLHEIVMALALSAGRYLVFSLQFFLLLRCFGIDVGFWQAFPAIAATFLATAAIPLPAIADVGIRTPASLFFIGALVAETHGCLPPDAAIAIASASVFLWIINLALPGMAGAIWMLGVRRKS